jgi:predicted nuclease with TOPRIM domain
MTDIKGKLDEKINNRSNLVEQAGLLQSQREKVVVEILRVEGEIRVLQELMDDKGDNEEKEDKKK